MKRYFVVIIFPPPLFTGSSTLVKGYKTLAAAKKYYDKNEAASISALLVDTKKEKIITNS